MADITPKIYDVSDLKRRKNKRVEDALSVGQTIILVDNVIEQWTAKERLEGVITVKFTFHKATKKDNFLHGASHYQVKRNAAGHPVLIRVSE